jgi:hypothetical protein
MENGVVNERDRKGNYGEKAQRVHQIISSIAGPSIILRS